MERLNDICIWVYDRINQGLNEEVGSLDICQFDDVRCSIIKDEDGIYNVFFDDDMINCVVLSQYDTPTEIKNEINLYFSN